MSLPTAFARLRHNWDCSDTLEQLMEWRYCRSVFRLVGGLVSQLSHRSKEEVDDWALLLAKLIRHSSPPPRWRVA